LTERSLVTSCRAAPQWSQRRPRTPSG
jgi:hypothetical protein